MWINGTCAAYNNVDYRAYKSVVYFWAIDAQLEYSPGLIKRMNGHMVIYSIY